MTTRTLSEIAATCTKAARGAGCPWGIAQEAGTAARLLEAHGLPGTTTLAHLFSAPRSCACTGQADAAACGLAQMVALSDAPPDQALRIDTVAAPLLMLAPLILEGGSWRMDWEGGAAGCGPDGAWIMGEAPKVASVTIKRQQDGQKGTGSSWHSRPVLPEAWAALQSLAARTYVPETDASRASGAGPDDSNSD